MLKKTLALACLTLSLSANAVDIEHGKLNTDPAMDYITVDGSVRQYKSFDAYDLSCAAPALVYK